MDTQTIFQLLCHEVRLKLLGLIAVRPQTAVQLATKLSLTPTAIQQNLLRLQNAGLIQTLDDEFYQFVPKQLTLRIGQLFKQTHQLYPFGKQWTPKEKKMLAIFVDANGRLQASYPTKHKQIALIVRWLASYLEIDRIYTEPEINEFVHRFHPDHAFWRRYLVDYGEMKRANGRYWSTKRESYEST